MSQKKTLVSFNKKMPKNFHATGDLYMVDKFGRVLMETRGITEFGRPQTKKQKKRSGLKMLGIWGQGTNRVQFFEDTLEKLVVMTVKGGVHPTSFKFKSSYDKRTFALVFNRALGFKVSRDAKGGHRVYIGKK